MKNLNEKLEVLNLCLVKESIPEELPDELKEYQNEFDEFKQIAQGCTSSTDEIYLDALRRFRDVLLSENK